MRALHSKGIAGPVRTIKVTSLQLPTQAVLFLENRLKAERKVDAAPSHSALGQPASCAHWFVGRDRGVGNLHFTDGHLESVRGNLVVETAPGSPNQGRAILPQEWIIWTANLASKPN